MKNSIDDIRNEIDTVDQQIHDLLMKRAELVMTIGDEKRRKKAQMIQPDREAIVIRRLMERHHGPLQKAVIVRIWRELISAAAILQTDMKVAIYAPTVHAQDYTDMARDYFGSIMPMHHVANPLMAISMVRDGEASFAVVPWPEDQAENPWWAYLGGETSEKTMRIMVRLPYGDQARTKGHPEFRALVVAKLAFQNSGQDHSFLLLDLDQTVSRAKVLDKTKILGMNVISIHSQRMHGLNDRSLHLIEVDTYLANDDPRLQLLLDRLENPEGRCNVMGGYPIMPYLNDSSSDSKKRTA